MCLNNRSFGICRCMAMLLMLVCVFTILPHQAQAASNVDVFYCDHLANNNRVYAVQVSSSASLPNSEICVERLQEAGYNAYIYRTSSYRIMVGVFANESDAEELLNEIHNVPNVSGVHMYDAFITEVKINDRGAEQYAAPYYGERHAERSDAAEKKTAAPVSKPVKIDVYDATAAANNNSIYGVQVSSSQSRKNSEICVERLRDAGYNAYICRGSSYRILIGVFENERDAEELLNEIHNVPNVRGVHMYDAFITKVKINDRGMEAYADPYYD